jgi:hypothetical protein
MFRSCWMCIEVKFLMLKLYEVYAF